MEARVSHMIAAEILYGNCSEWGRLDADLYDYLNEIECLCGKVHGEVTSRQIVSLALATWQRMKAFRNALAARQDR